MKSLMTHALMTRALMTRVWVMTVLLLTSPLFGLTPAWGQSDSKPSDPTPSPFVSTTINIGCVVSDIDAAVEFYTQAIGFKVARSFSVDAALASEIGLTDQKELNVEVLTLGQGKGATQLKLMQVQGPSATQNSDFIHSTLGLSYLTIVVKDIDAAVNRLKSAGASPVAQPKQLPGTELMLVLVKDPDGNFIELVAPAK